MTVLLNNVALTSDQRCLFGDAEWWDPFLRTNPESQNLCTD